MCAHQKLAILYPHTEEKLARPVGLHPGIQLFPKVPPRPTVNLCPCTVTSRAKGPALGRSPAPSSRFWEGSIRTCSVHAGPAHSVFLVLQWPGQGAAHRSQTQTKREEAQKPVQVTTLPRLLGSAICPIPAAWQPAFPSHTATTTAPVPFAAVLELSKNRAERQGST